MKNPQLTNAEKKVNEMGTSLRCDACKRSDAFEQQDEPIELTNYHMKGDRLLFETVLKCRHCGHKQHVEIELEDNPS
jgi:hypothetical protein